MLRLRVPADLALFAGHFPGCPILPGIVQVDWAVRYARGHFDGIAECCGVDAFKCLAPVLPGAELTLELTHNVAHHALQFRYRHGSRTVSSGTVRFRAPA